MIYNYRILPKAEKEIYDSGDWYERKKPGLGYRFEKEVVVKIKSITGNPLHYQLKGRFREVSLEDFPYIIVFRIDEDKKMIVISSVFHTSRNPNKKL